MAAVERREQRAADLLIDLVRLEVGEGPHPNGAADIVDQDVDAAEAGQCGLHRAGCPIVGLQVAAVGEGLGAGLGRDFADEVRPIDQQNPPTLGGDAQGEAPADALGGSGHDHDLAGEAFREHHAAALAVSLGANFS